VLLALVDPHVHDHPQFGFIGVLVGELDTLHRRLLDPTSRCHTLVFRTPFSASPVFSLRQPKT
jgi:hypothetical protein